MNASQLFSLWPSQIAAHFRRRQLRCAIVATERDIALNLREIKDKFQADSYLCNRLKVLKSKADI